MFAALVRLAGAASVLHILIYLLNVWLPFFPFFHSVLQGEELVKRSVDPRGSSHSQVIASLDILATWNKHVFSCVPILELSSIWR